MIKLLDYYSVMLVRFFGKVREFSIPAIMGCSLCMNYFSFVILFFGGYFGERSMWLIIYIPSLIIINLISIKYNLQRQQKLVEKYAGEGRKSRIRGKLLVILYEMLTVAFFVWMLLRAIEYWS